MKIIAIIYSICLKGKFYSLVFKPEYHDFSDSKTVDMNIRQSYKHSL